MALTSISISAPNSAEEGAVVDFQVIVRNMDSKGHTFYIECWAPTATLGDKILDKPFTWLWQLGLDGNEITYRLSMVMLSVDALIFVSVEEWTGAGWLVDNLFQKEVAVIVQQTPPPGPSPEPPSSEFRSLSVAVS